jgi:sugar phosphate isomerase/epimerase
MSAPSVLMSVAIFGAATVAAEAPAEKPKGLPNPFFAYCHDTHDAKKRSLKDQADLLKELGFAGVGHLGIGNLDQRLKTLDDAGLKLFQIYVRVNVDPTKPAYEPGLKEAITRLKGREVSLALTLCGKPASTPDNDPPAVEVVREIADLAAEAGLRVTLYPHVGDWVERVEDAIRVVKKVDRKNVGVQFNLCHWLKTGDEAGLDALLKDALPHLFVVTINGADHADRKAGWDKLIQPLDSGAFDIAGFLKRLKDLGYKGPIGLMCYGLGGDARDHLARSMAAWRKLSERLAAGPQ